MKKHINLIIVILVVLVMIVPIIIDSIGSKVLTEIKYSDFAKYISDTKNYNFSLIYVGSNDSEDTKSEIKKIVEKYDKENGDQLSAKAYFMDSSTLSDAEKLDIFGISNINEGYVFVSNNEVIRIETSKLDSSKLNLLVKEYTNNGVDASISYFKYAATAKEYQASVKEKKKVTMAVFGRDSCFYCNQFKPVYNTVAEEYNVSDIYYFNSDGYDPTEYAKVLSTKLTIPGRCSASGADVDLGADKAFNTPLVLFTKNNKVIDCIDGYVNKATLISKLKELEMIKE